MIDFWFWLVATAALRLASACFWTLAEASTWASSPSMVLPRPCQSKVMAPRARVRARMTHKRGLTVRDLNMAGFLLSGNREGKQDQAGLHGSSFQVRRLAGMVRLPRAMAFRMRWRPSAIEPSQAIRMG